MCLNTRRTLILFDELCPPGHQPPFRNDRILLQCLCACRRKNPATWDSQESYHNGHVMIVRGAFPRTVADPNFNEAAMDTNTLRYNVIAVFVFNGSGRRHRDS